MKTISWGIIGVGDVTEVKSGPAFYKIEHSALVAVMRRDEAKLKDYAFRHNVNKFYTSADDLINDPEVNAIYVATPPSSHKEYAIKAMQAGKPVYVEKPMAMNYAECEEMKKVSEETGQKLFVAYYRRALSYFLQVKELIDNGKIGEVLTVNVQYFRKASVTDVDPGQQTWRVKKDIAGGGYFFDMAPHTLDILDFLIGEIEEAKAFVGNLGGYYDVEDTITTAFRFKSGVMGTGIWNFVSSKVSERDIVEITGTKGSVSFNTFLFGPIVLTTTSGINHYEAIQPEHIQQPLIQTIVDELRGNGRCPSSAESGARTSRVMDMIFGTIK